jgi:hypothetical protein
MSKFFIVRGWYQCKYRQHLAGPVRKHWGDAAARFVLLQCA